MEAWFGQWGAKQVENDVVTPPATVLYDLPYIRRNKTETGGVSPRRAPKVTRATSAATTADPTINFTESLIGENQNATDSEEAIFRDRPDDFPATSTECDVTSQVDTEASPSEQVCKKKYVLNYDIPVVQSSSPFESVDLPKVPEEVHLEEAAKLASFELHSGQIIEIGEPGQTNTIRWTCTNADGTEHTQECIITGRAQLSVSF